MSKIIKITDMTDLPKSCNSCPLRFECDTFLNDMDFYNSINCNTQRHELCPLRDVSEMAVTFKNVCNNPYRLGIKNNNFYLRTGDDELVIECEVLPESVEVE